TSQHLALELFVFADVGRDHAADLARSQQQAGPEVVDAYVVADERQIPRAAPQQGVDQVLGNPAQPEAAHHDGGAVWYHRRRFVDAAEHLVHDAVMAWARSPAPCSSRLLRARTCNTLGPRRHSSRSRPRSKEHGYTSTPTAGLIIRRTNSIAGFG